MKDVVGRDAKGPASPRPAGGAPVGATLVFLVALNLRPALTSVGPLLPRIGASTGLGKGVQGLLGALPLIAFAVISPLVHRVSRRLGMERAVLLALLALAAGLVVRSYTGDPGLWVGTLVVGSAIAVSNVLVPTIVRRDYPAHVSVATGIYSAFLTIAASVASAVAVPLSSAAGWRGSLAFWAIPAAIVAVLWLPRALPALPALSRLPAVDAPEITVWKQPSAWLLTAFMGLQSTTFYIMVTWLPTFQAAAGITARQAGLRLFTYQIVGVLSGLTIPRFMRRAGSQVGAAVAASTPLLVGVLGMLIAPALGVVWVVIAGLSSGSSLVVVLTLISLRGRTNQETAQLFGMAQSLGYLFAAMGPILAGYLAQLTGSWAPTLILLAALSATQVIIAVPVGRNRGPQQPWPTTAEASRAKPA